MAVVVDRSMNSELLAGMVDGTYKRIVMNRSNYPDPDEALEIANKKNLNRGDCGFGVFEAPEKRTGDGRFTD